MELNRATKDGEEIQYWECDTLTQVSARILEKLRREAQLERESKVTLVIADPALYDNGKLEVVPLISTVNLLPRINVVLVESWEELIMLTRSHYTPGSPMAPGCVDENCKTLVFYRVLEHFSEQLDGQKVNYWGNLLYKLIKVTRCEVDCVEVGVNETQVPNTEASSDMISLELVLSKWMNIE
ncbi:hypothetical protein QCA50_017710 [Cerrena zonata]|uniref:Uncharacterized protein n=1 Tax=Cerrena zonata TaxID=2478898 RepID=A0AAW0FIF5_9APHY